MLLHFPVLPHYMTVYFGKRRLAPETQSWQSTRCHFNEASRCHENAVGCAMPQDGQHCATHLGKVRREASAVCTISSLQGWKKSSVQSLNVRLLQDGGGAVQLRLLNVPKIWTSRSGCFLGTGPTHAGNRSRSVRKSRQWRCKMCL